MTVLAVVAGVLLVVLLAAARLLIRLTTALERMMYGSNDVAEIERVRATFPTVP